MFNSAVDGNQFNGLETSYGGNVDHYTAFLVIVLSHILESQEKSSDHSILEKNIEMLEILNVIDGGELCVQLYICVCLCVCVCVCVCISIKRC